MRNFIIFILSLISFISFSQTNEDISMFNEINKIRKDPKSYISVVETYIHDQEVMVNTFGESKFWSKRIKTAEELINVLKRTKSMDTLSFDTNMYVITKNHSDYLKESGKYTHIGYNNESLDIRFKFIDYKKFLNENIAYSKGNPLLELLLDIDVPNRGHRMNILNENVKYISISINDYVVVQNFRD